MNEPLKKILIVGAGPTGLTLACALYRYGIPCRIIDKRTMPSTHSKALGVSATSLLIFERLGVSPDFVKNNTQMQDTYFYWNGNRILHTNYRYLTNTKYPFMLLAKQTETERYLNECLEKLGGKVERGVTLTYLNQESSKVNIILKHHDGRDEIGHYEEVIGCDGSQSVVRKMIGADFSGKDYGLHFVYGDFELEGFQGDPRVAHYFMEGSDLFIMIPTITGTYRIVGLVPGDRHEKPEPNIKDLQEYLDRFGPKNIRLKNPTQFGSVPIYYRVSSKIRNHRVFLAGDAFHLFSPIGGQGMNSGIQDAYNLAWKLAYVRQGKAKRSLLDSYEAERLPLVREVVENVKKSVELILRKDKYNDPMVKNILPVFSNRPHFRCKLPKNYSGFNYRYEQSEWIQEHLAEAERDGSPAAGEYINDKKALHHAVELTLLVYLDGSSASSLLYKKQIQNLIKMYPFLQVEYRPRGSVEKFVLIRPDGYIAYQDLLDCLEKFEIYLNQFCQKARPHE